MQKVVFLTIGQSPRTDVLNEIRPILKDINIVEIGALDSLSTEQIKELTPTKNEEILVTRLRTGEQVTLSKKKLLPLLQEIIKQGEEQADILALLCTDDLHEIKSRKLLIKPYNLMRNFIVSLEGIEKLGIVVPAKEQIKYAINRWASLKFCMIVTSFSPYVHDLNEFKKIATMLEGTDLIVLDCIGYTMKHKEILLQITGKPVILPRTLLAFVIKELIPRVSTE